MSNPAQSHSYHVRGNGVDRLISILHPNTLSVIFCVHNDNIVLVDAETRVYIWDEDAQKFDGVESAVQPLTLEGDPIANVAGSSAAVHSALTVARPSYQPPAAPPFSVAGAVAVTNPISLSTSHPTALPSQVPKTKTFMVQRAERQKNGRPSRSLELAHITMTEDEANVRTMNNKLRALPGFSNLVLCNIRGIAIPDDSTTQRKSFISNLA